MTSDREQAEQDRVIYGVGFLVDGVRVAPGRVQVLAFQVPVSRSWRDDGLWQFVIGLVWGLVLGAATVWAWWVQ